jgi:hypothetical protein
LEIIFKNFLLGAPVDCAPILSRNARIEFALRVVARLREVVNYGINFFICYHAYSMAEKKKKSRLFLKKLSVA